MSSLPTSEVTRWEETFGIVSNHLRDAFTRSFPFKHDGEVSPTILGLRDAFYAFPVPTDVVLVDTGKVEAGKPRIFLPSEKEGPVWTRIAHHVGDTLGPRITFHGARALVDFDNWSSLLVQHFAFRDDDGSLESVRNLTSTGFWDEETLDIIDLIPFDIRERPEVYARHLTESLFMNNQQMLIRKFKKEIDYNTAYSLVRDPILSLAEWTRIDSTTALFVKLADGNPPTLEERQEAICDIQLIAKVPSDVKVTFRRAKDAYIFGYFRYDFFTLAVHYAALAIEAAIRARWTASLRENVTLTCGAKKERHAVPLSYENTQFLCKRKMELREDLS